MIPFHDTVRARDIPLMNWALIAVNLLVFLFETTLSRRQLLGFTNAFGLVPGRFWASPGLDQILTIFSSMFMHGGWWHLIGNLWILYIFGDNVEDRMGHLRYLLFYLLSGLVAALVHAFVTPLSRVSTIGASGAISGIMGAYLVLFPRARVLAFVPFFFLPWVVEVPALIFIGLWFVSQLFNGLFSLMASSAIQMYGGVAWWAHMGGFAAGLLSVKLFERRDHQRFHRDERWPW